MSVTIKTNKDSGLKITPYKNNPKLGYVTIESTETTLKDGGWLRNSTRTALLKADIETLNTYIGTKNVLPGKIIVNEFIEGTEPASFKSRIDSNKDYETAIKPHLKMSTSEDKGGIPLTIEGNRILRFTDYDPTGLLNDLIVKHDNVDELKAAKVAFEGRPANLEQGQETL
jgi:hypothetical protein